METHGRRLGLVALSALSGNPIRCGPRTNSWVRGALTTDWRGHEDDGCRLIDLRQNAARRMEHSRGHAGLHASIGGAGAASTECASIAAPGNHGVAAAA